MPLRLVQHLVAQRRLTEEAGQNILQAVAQPGATVDTVVLERGLVPEAELLEALSTCSGLRPVHLGDFEPNPEVAHCVPIHIAERWCVTPLSVDGPTLHVASGYPVARKELEEMGVLLGRPIELWVATELRVRDWIAHVYGVPLSPRLRALLARLDPARAALHPTPEAPPLRDEDVVEQTASMELEVDVELEPESDTEATTKASPTPGSDVGSPSPVQTPPPNGAPATSAAAAPLTSKAHTGPAAATSDVPAAPVTATTSTSGAPVEGGAPTSGAPAGVGMTTVPTGEASVAPVATPPPTSGAPASPDAAEPSTETPPTIGSNTGAATEAVPMPSLPGSSAPVTVATRGRVRAAPWLPPSLQAAVERGEDISERLAAAPMAAQLAWAAPQRPAGSAPGVAPAIAPVPAVRAEVLTEQDAAPEELLESPELSPVEVPPEPPRGLHDSGALAPQLERRQGASDSDAGAHGTGALAGSPEAQASAQRSPGRAGTSPDLHPAASLDSGSTEPVPTDAPTGTAATADTRGDSARAPEAESTPDWTLAQAQEVLREHARDRDALIRTILRYAGTTFSYAAVFAIRRGEAAGWSARGADASAPAFEEVRIPLDAPSLFRTVTVTRGSYVGGVPADGHTAGYLESFGRQPPRALFLYPVEVRGRPVALVYGDNAGRPVSQRRLAEFVLFCQELPAAFHQLLLQRRQRTIDTLPPETASLSTDVAGETPPPVAPAATARGPVGWDSFQHGELAPAGRAASLPPVLPALEYVPSDFSPLLRRLTGPDAAARLRAVAELARTPDASARVLARAFPGPSAWSRVPVGELPEAEELGPIPGALARLGRAGAGALAALLDKDDAEIRYLALLTAGSLPYPVLVDGILRGLFDLEPDISSAARAAAFALRRVPRMEASLPGLRRELISRDPLRRSLAARALGTLHDRAAVDGLINLTGSDDELTAQAAAEALREITRAGFGQNRPAWTRWWAENRGRRRSEWLVAALRAPELDLRVAAFEELSAALGETFEYQPETDPTMREQATRLWESALRHPQRARRLAAL